MPPETVSVARPGIFGNPFTVSGCREAGYQGDDTAIARRCVQAFRGWLGPAWRNTWDGVESESTRERLLLNLPKLRGRNLAYWCALDAPCHADVLLELANAPPNLTIDDQSDPGAWATAIAHTPHLAAQVRGDEQDQQP